VTAPTVITRGPRRTPSRCEPRSDGACRAVYGGQVPVLDATDPLPQRPRRIAVAGPSGAGKTTLAARIAELLGIPHIELDGLFHGPGWTPRESFAADVDAFSAGPNWVTEWQYPAARAVLADRADLLVWLDFTRATVMRQVVRRTVRRRLRRQVLWNGNVEPAMRTVLTDPEYVVRWAWSTWSETGPRVAALHRRRPELTIVRLADRRAARHWLSGPLRRAGDLPSSRP
jgi:adenylate kinase family enzyme